MGIKSFVVAAFAAVVVAKPIPDPLNMIRQSGPAAGQVRLIFLYSRRGSRRGLQWTQIALHTPYRKQIRDYFSIVRICRDIKDREIHCETWTLSPTTPCGAGHLVAWSELTKA